MYDLHQFVYGDEKKRKIISATTEDNENKAGRQMIKFDMSSTCFSSTPLYSTPPHPPFCPSPLKNKAHVLFFHSTLVNKARQPSNLLFHSWAGSLHTCLHITYLLSVAYYDSKKERKKESRGYNFSTF